MSSFGDLIVTEFQVDLREQAVLDLPQELGFPRGWLELLPQMKN